VSLQRGIDGRPAHEIPDAEEESYTDLLRIVFSEKRKAAKGPAIFIDRDGVINCRRPDDYVLNWSQFIFIPGIREALKQIASLGLPMIVISNQAAVGKGLLDPAGLREITAQMHRALAADGTFLTAAYYCTHRIEEDCVCRKPKPALLHNAAGDFNIDLSRSIFIGDSETDVQAAHAASCKPILFSAGSEACHDSRRSVGYLPTARDANELFGVAAKCLQDQTLTRP